MSSKRSAQSRFAAFISPTVSLISGLAVVVPGLPARAVSFDVVVPERLYVDNDVIGLALPSFAWLIATEEPITEADLDGMEITVESADPRVTGRFPIPFLGDASAPILPGEVLGRTITHTEDVYLLMLEPGELLKAPFSSAWGMEVRYPLGVTEVVPLHFEVRIGGDELAFDTEVHIGPRTGRRDPRESPVRLSSTPIALVQATKTAVLVADLDGDDRAGPGDTLEYVVTIDNIGSAEAPGIRYSDVPDTLSELVVGSVRTTLGEVVRGNASGDDAIEIELGTIAARQAEIVRYEVVVGALPEGVLELVNQGTVAGGFGVLPTDDPQTPAPGDPTRTAVANTLLDRCGRDRAELEDALGSCREDLDAVLADADGDGVLDLLDACPGTRDGETTDRLGCSLAQFCEGALASRSADGGSGREVLRSRSDCFLADWRNDEPRGASDCRMSGERCVPR